MTDQPVGPGLILIALVLRMVVGLTTRLGLQWLHREAEVDAQLRVADRAFSRNGVTAFQGRRIVDAWSAASLLPAIDVGALGALALTPVIVAVGGPLTLLVIGGLVAFAIPSYIRTGTVALAAANEYAERREHLEFEVIHLIRSLWEIRGVGGTTFAFRRLDALSERESESEERAVRQTIGSSLVTEFIGGVAVGLVAMVVGFRVLDGGSLTRALIAVFLTIEISTALRSWSASFHTRQSFRDLVITTTPRGERESDHVAPSISIRVDELTTYAPAQPVSFTVRPGETLLLRGPSGIGKSTVLRVLIGDIHPRGGTVECSAERIGYIDPYPVFSEGPLADNVVIANDATFHSFSRVCHALRLSREVSADMQVQRGGANFSHGERIKIAIARALANDAELLILDDVASFLDHESRHAVANVVKSHGVTVVEATNDEPICQPDATITLQEVAP